MQKRSHTSNLHHPRCLACGGTGYAEFPKATDSRVEILLGDSGLSITRTVYEGQVSVYRGHFIRLDGKHIPVLLIDGKWVAQMPKDQNLVVIGE